MDDFFNQFKGDFEAHEFSIELKAGESLFMLTIEFPQGEEILMVRDREMKVITTILNYNRFPYTVEPIA